MSLNFDSVPCALPSSNGYGRAVVHEDNDAAATIVVEGSSPDLRNCPRTHRIDLDSRFEQVRKDIGVVLKYIHTNLKAASS